MGNFRTKIDERNNFYKLRENKIYFVFTASADERYTLVEPLVAFFSRLNTGVSATGWF
ncbi:MAG: hypothetical protein LBG96_11735 [Tannerella sp.]|jgi:hypothetical protein|nr:hypothetical protein [Tannerella sp.]